MAQELCCGGSCLGVGDCVWTRLAGQVKRCGAAWRRLLCWLLVEPCARRRSQEQIQRVDLQRVIEGCEKAIEWALCIERKGRRQEQKRENQTDADQHNK